MKVTEKRLVFCTADDWKRGTIRKLRIKNDALVPDIRDSITGSILIGPVDSGQSLFRWDRVIIGADLPEGSAIEATCFASDQRENGNMREMERLLKDESVDYFGLHRVLPDLMNEESYSGTDFLPNVRGRFLWLLLTLIQSDSGQPAVKSVTFRMEGDHMADYLPGIYREDETVRRFLSVFNSIHTDMERKIGEMPGMMDVDSCSPDMVRYLAGWLGIEDGRFEAEGLRAGVRNIIHEYETLYTPAGVRRSIKRLTGQDPLILEYAFADPNAPDCPDPELFRRFFGEDPYRFFVFLNKAAFLGGEDIGKFQEKMKNLTPAGMTMVLVTTGLPDIPGQTGEEPGKEDIAAFLRLLEKEELPLSTDMMIGGEDIE